MKRSSCLVLLMILALAAAFVYFWPEECRRFVYMLNFSRLLDRL